jgi:hypothetical protein
MIRYPVVSTWEAGTLRHASAGDLSACEGLAPDAASLPLLGSTQIVCMGPALITNRPGTTVCGGAVVVVLAIVVVVDVLAVVAVVVVVVVGAVVGAPPVVVVVPLGDPG